MNYQPQATFDLDTVPPEYRDQVQDLIPPAALAGPKGYVHRTCKHPVYAPSGMFDFELFDRAMLAGDNILLTGPTGAAKTTALRAMSAAIQAPFYRMECSASMDPVSEIGRTVGRSGETRFIPGKAVLVVAFGGILVLDEINMLHPRLTSSYHALYDGYRRLNVVEAGWNVRAGREGLGQPQPVLLAATQNTADYRGVIALGQAMRNRFPVSMPWGYDPDVEAQLTMSARLRRFADQVRNDPAVRSPMSTNMLQEFERSTRNYSFEMARWFLVEHFDEDEQGPVARAFEAHSAQIAAELGVSV